MMPELDGWETCTAIHQLYETKEIKIMPYMLAYSTFDSREDAIKSQNSGICGISQSHALRLTYAKKFLSGLVEPSCIQYY